MFGKKSLLIGILLALALGVSGCDGISIFGEGTEQKVSNSVSSTDFGSADKEKTTEVYTYDGVNEGYWGSYPEHYQLTLLDDKNASFVYVANHMKGYKSTDEYSVTYEKSENQIEAVFVNNAEMAYSFAVIFELQGDKVVNVWQQKFSEEAINSVAGSYTGYSEEYGNMKLTIQKDGEAVLVFNDTLTLNGYLSALNGMYELYVAPSDYTEEIDWYVDLENNQFTYMDYWLTVYGDYEGAYEADGDLGKIYFGVSKRGEVQSEIEVEGEVRQFFGRIHVSEGYINSAYLESEDGYSLDLSFYEVDDGVWHYGGKLSKPLAFG